MRDKDNSDNLAYQAFAERFRQAVKRSGLSQSKIADLAGITEASMSRYMEGSRIPHPIIFERLCTSMGCDADRLLGRRKNVNANKFDDVIKFLREVQGKIDNGNDYGNGLFDGISYAIQTLEVMK